MKLKKSAVESVSDESKSAPGGAFISARLRNPAEDLGAQGKSTGDTVGGVCAILATVLLIAVTALLYFNWDAIQSA